MLPSTHLGRRFALTLSLISLAVVARALIGPAVSASSNAGDLDPSFDPGTGATVGGSVQALIVQPDEKVIIGGSFSSYNGTLRNGIARVNSDGALDTAFDSAAGFNNTVYALALQSDGKIIAGGAFTRYNGVTRNRLTRINADGTLDTSFVPGVVFSTVYAVAIQSDGRIVVGGDTTPFLRRLNSDGSIDSTFHPTINGTVKAIAIQNDGKLVFGGSFSTVNSSQRQYVARVTSDGTLDGSFFPLLNPASNGGVNSLCIQTDGKVIIGGKLAGNGGFPLTTMRLKVDGSNDSSFTSLGTTGVVSSVAIQPDGKVLYGGSFSANYGNCKYP